MRDAAEYVKLRVLFLSDLFARMHSIFPILMNQKTMDKTHFLELIES